MSKQAERLREALKSRLNGITAPMESRGPTDSEVKEIVALIISELGITEGMVNTLRSTFDVSPHRAYANDRGLEAADALSALMEVGNG